MMDKCRLKEKDTFEQNDIDILVYVFVLSKFVGGFLGKVGIEMDRVMFFQRQY